VPPEVEGYDPEPDALVGTVELLLLLDELELLLVLLVDELELLLLLLGGDDVKVPVLELEPLPLTTVPVTVPGCEFCVLVVLVVVVLELVDVLELVGVLVFAGVLFCVIGIFKYPFS
jgi:hypothetical protein